MQYNSTNTETSIGEIFSLFPETPLKEKGLTEFYNELGNHLGNVLSTVSDKKLKIDDNSDDVIDYYTADILMSQDYMAFGMRMPGRSYNSDAYRYGFNGMESDDELKGVKNSYTTHFRQYDPRLGRWLSRDPLSVKFPWQSPYVGLDNNPITNIDVFGDSTTYFYDGEVVHVSTDELDNAIVDLTDS